MQAEILATGHVFHSIWGFQVFGVSTGHVLTTCAKRNILTNSCYNLTANKPATPRTTANHYLSGKKVLLMPARNGLLKTITPYCFEQAPSFGRYLLKTTGLSEGKICVWQMVITTLIFFL